MRVTARRTALLIAAIALACAGLGLWLGQAVAEDTGSIVVIALACAVLGSFAPTTIRWATGEVRKHGAAHRPLAGAPPGTRVTWQSVRL